jgi:hypothetical protein
MITRSLIGILVGDASEAAAELAAFTDANVPLKISDSITTIALA